MSAKELEQIRQIEKEAKVKVENAKKQAREILNNAHDSAEKKISDAKKSGHEENESYKKKTQQEIIAQVGKITADNDQAISDLQKNIADRKENASEEVKKRILMG